MHRSPPFSSESLGEGPSGLGRPPREFPPQQPPLRNAPWPLPMAAGKTVSPSVLPSLPPSRLRPTGSPRPAFPPPFARSPPSPGASSCESVFGFRLCGIREPCPMPQPAARPPPTWALNPGPRTPSAKSLSRVPVPSRGEGPQGASAEVGHELPVPMATVSLTMVADLRTAREGKSRNL